ncbi:MAG: hypothetical protein LQ338_001722 [Usnochroma carphineum]|nr:MAG: hypothetical protein LQ338_001722 [Usnochroma carphineum]
MEEQTAAMTNRSLRTIRTELEYLTDARIITSTQLSSILSQLPVQTPLHAPLQSPPATTTATSPGANLASHLKNTLLPSSEKRSSSSVPTLNEKSDSYYAPQQPTTNPTPATAAAAIPPPAYSHTPQTLASASALYEYTPSDAGDLALLPNDRITITEFMNADWAKGRNERTGAEGIFPRSYVFIIDEKKAGMMAPPQSSAAVAGSSTTGYGNVPLEVSQSGGGGESKFNQQGKKFGKKMGNAAIFGAGATIGSNIVNGIF